MLNYDNLETNKNTITREQEEFLSAYLHVCGSMYYGITGRKLKSVDQLIDVIASGDMTIEDAYYAYLDTFGLNGDESAYLDDHLTTKFDYLNYFPDDTKHVGDGCWVKIRTENGFELHWAKRSSRKRRWYEEMDRLTERLDRYVDGQEVDLGRLCLMREALTELSVRSEIGLNPYEIRINRTRSKTEYYMPYQYELVKDIEEFADAYVAKVPGTGARTLYTSKNEDAVFYLRSRGVSERVARMMAAMKQSYFTFDMETAMDAFNDTFRIKIVKA